MATIVTADKLREMLGVAPPPAPAPAAGGAVDVILKFLDNPLIQVVLRRIIDRFLPPAPQAPATGGQPQPDAKAELKKYLNGKNIMTMMTAIIDPLPDQMTVGQIKKDIVENLTKYEGMIDEYLQKLFSQ